MPDAPLVPCQAPGCRTLGPCPEHDIQRGRLERAQKPSWSAWYHLARWRHPVWGLRTRTLAASPLCRLCRAEGRLVAATQVDHIVPHRGSPVTFWEPTNLQALCDRHHNEKTGRGE